MKMEWIIAMLIGGLVLVGDFFAGYQTSQSSKATTNINNIKQETTVNQRTESVQQNLQIQSTAFVPGVTNVTIDIRNYTNIIIMSNWIISNNKSTTN